MASLGGARVLQVGPLMADLELALRERHDADRLPDEPAAASEHLAAAGHEVEVVVTSGRTGVDAALMARLPALGAVVHFGVGHDRTDLAAARDRGIQVSTTPDVLTDCVADTAVGLVLDVVRGLSRADRFVRAGRWSGHHAFPLQRRMSGMKVGILGLGRIGAAVAHRLEAFGCEVGYHNRRRRPGSHLRYHGSVLALARASDVLVVAAGGGDSTHHLVGAEELRALGPAGFLVNVGRGSVVDEAALVEALRAGTLAGAGLDVYADEPHVPEALLGLEQVVLLPHVASGTVETRAAMRDLVLDNVDSFLRTRRVLTPVG